MAATVEIYNPGSDRPIGRVHLHHAIGMLRRGVAVVRESVPGAMFGPYEKPRSVSLVRYVFERWRYATTGRVTFSKKALRRRDKDTCAYCRKHGTTVDHVIPRKQGGLSTFTNTVISCAPCNSKKGGRTPEQAGMKLLWQPYEPTPAQVYA